ncbi:MAG: orotidine-5'-phosphate decarboxylase [Clostridia bacterium]|nr:orotidine-5'-phosphate decarboxylase [Clostridia bacterium]
MDKLIEKIIQTQNPSVVGLDTDFAYLPDEMRAGVTDFEGAAKAIVAFNKAIVDEIADVVPAVKVQIAYYEMYGVHGMQAFLETCAYAKSKGMVVIADAKRNDIGSTASCYAKAFLGKTPVEGQLYAAFDADMLTVNGYLGTDGIAPFVKELTEDSKGIFALVKTSNPSSGELQDLTLSDGRKVYECMGDMVAKWGEGNMGKYGYTAVGAVVGATHKEQAEILRKRLPTVFFLIPGYGAQGGTADDLSVCFDERGLGGVVNSSRGILCAYRKDAYKGMSFAEAARAASIDMKNDILRAMQARGIQRIGG